MTGIFDAYLKKLREIPLEEHTEHTGRSALEALLNQFAAEAFAPGITVQHEPKREADKGAPDFKIKRQGMIRGYVEVKEIGANLDKALKSDQIKRYRTLSENIVLTDYLEFIWIGRDGDPKTGIKLRATLAYRSDLEGRKLRVSPERAEAVGKLIAAFFSEPEQGIGRAQQLALALAARSQLLRDFLTSELTRQAKEHQKGRLHALYEVFREQVFHELTVKEFADAFAQMLAYGLFLARLNAKEDDVVTLENVRSHIPGSFRLIRELVRFLDELNEPDYIGARWVVDEVLSIVNGLNLHAIRDDLSFRQRKAISRNVRAGDEEEHRLFERDPFIYFYEDYLKAYDPAMRKGRGVYYTPPPIVNFIVRAVDDILKESFGIADGLADHKRVTVLDFACGTGTFLLEVFQRVLDNIGGPRAGKADLIVREHLLRNVFGFEYLIAPYTIAHLKLSQYLKEQNHPLKAGERLQVFLTNTLEPIEPQRDLNFPAISAEVEAAQTVKDRDILVITGNPPYSGHSKNKGVWTTRSTDGYKYTVERRPDLNESDGLGPEERVPLGERNPKWLNDDYVKFIRFAQLKMDAVEEGIVGIITNHSWLDNPTFRGMRQSLMRSFDQIYVLDLHGSTKPRELAPDGAENENVFDIQKGVAVTLFVKRRGLEHGIWFSELWGSRLEKYRATATAGIDRIGWKEARFFAPYFMYRPLDWTNWSDYERGWQIADSLNPDAAKSQIFAVNVLGFQTHRDHFAVAFTRKDMERRVRDMRDASISDQRLGEAYDIKDNRDWSLEAARRLIGANPGAEQRIIDCSFRPFDERPCFFGPEFMDYPRRELLDNVALRENIQLLVSRQVGTSHWRHVFCATEVAESCCVSDGSKEQNYCFPLWLYGKDERVSENLTSSFRSFLDARFDYHYSSGEVIGYIYGVLHAPAYRTRYAEFLRIDFPRVPFPEGRADFDALSALGSALVEAHLLRELPRRSLGQYVGKGDHLVEFVRYSPQDQAISINATQSFRPVPQAVWDYHIGGYQVLDKYLKSRKGRDALARRDRPHRGGGRQSRLHHRADATDRHGLPGGLSGQGISPSDNRPPVTAKVRRC